MYQRLAAIDVSVIVVAWQTRRTIDGDVLRAQYAERIVTCQVHDPRRQGRGRGSNTVISNVHFGDFVPLTAFFEQEFGIGADTVDPVIAAVTQNRRA